MAKAKRRVFVRMDSDASSMPVELRDDADVFVTFAVGVPLGDVIGRLQELAAYLRVHGAGLQEACLTGFEENERRVTDGKHEHY